jgi:GTP-dependent dephospho-CoA kinase
MPAAVTRSGSSDEAVWVVPASLRPALAAVYGPVRAGIEADRAIQTLGTFGACGDRVTSAALSLGNSPLIGIVDFKTRRNERVDPNAFAPLAQRARVRVRNPAGMLTARLRRAVSELARTGGGLIEVDGEEDLGSLALVESLPVGATVIYGIPGEGVSFVSVTPESKERVRSLIAQMEPRRIDLGA